MKHVLMIVLLISGFAMTESFGQAACKPADCKPANCKPADCKLCPPGCCITSCKPGAAASSSAEATTVPVDVTFASWVAEGGMPNCDLSKISGKERKACLAACKSAQVSCTPAAAAVPACSGSKGTPEKTVYQASADVRH